MHVNMYNIAVSFCYMHVSVDFELFYAAICFYNNHMMLHITNNIIVEEE